MDRGSIDKGKAKAYLAGCKDAMPFDLAAHDRRFHKNGWRPGIPCKVRDGIRQYGDRSDRLFSLERIEESQNPRSIGDIHRDVMAGRHVNAHDMNRWARSPKGMMAISSMRGGR